MQSTSHRKNLLQFALGEKAVSARLAEDQATNEAKAASDAVHQLSQQLSGHHQGTTLLVFENLAEASDADQQIEVLQKRVSAANNSALILKRALPIAVPIPNLDLNALFAVFRTTIENVQADAEAIVRAHVAKLASPAAEAWLSQGRSFDDGGACPYCAQPTEGIDLIQAYRTHFNALYADLKTRVGQLDKTVSTSTSPTIASSFAQGVTTANAIAAAWEDHVTIAPTAFDAALAARKLRDLDTLLSRLVTRKQTNPTSEVSSDQDRAEADKVWGELMQLMLNANQAIGVTREAIDSFLQKLAKENVQQLQFHIQQLQLSKRRHTPAVKLMFDELVVARVEALRAEGLKRVARDNLDALMKQMLKDYEQSVNALLEIVGLPI